ncbi:hypothetical protein [Campylobacter canadensis]|uniref:Uncharacterized protein n=1 Tax=Campylobacter canadensis TaxID=449520 RepID=A0ABS7WT14_9BACT|nr:hypothetical protein [Campylobacter canadensis]MBZ7987658.1 hypothetical protein [Campylobacter canadensis]MBZ7995019.1 hypothetical protein [Campylobacter canadensis]MBZ7996961.1 hypothetical protein [Campylobacter canadensis]MBZ7998805.1 hypothetical protein [Campylobacter canadensis]MBZ8000440.1 hypothetical protein [Campylobacter canadensis]
MKIELKISHPDFLQDLQISEVLKAYELCLKSVKMYEFFYKEFKNELFFRLWQERLILNDLFNYEYEFVFEASLEEAYILALAQELKIVYECKKASLLCKNSECKDLIFRLWASSVNESQKALKEGLVGLNEPNINSFINTLLKDIIK